MASRIRPVRLTVSDQRRLMREHCPQMQRENSAGPTIWLGPLITSSISTTYTVEIRYVRGLKPEVWVREPQLEISRADFSTTHIFSEGCLCLHAHDEWDDTMPIATSTVGWTAEWLWYYEAWRT